jgi:hypothetical protein
MLDYLAGVNPIRLMLWLQVTIHDYSIRVERLPQDATADELVDFFGQYGEVGSSSSNRGAFKHTVTLIVRL